MQIRHNTRHEPCPLSTPIINKVFYRSSRAPSLLIRIIIKSVLDIFLPSLDLLIILIIIAAAAAATSALATLNSLTPDTARSATAKRRVEGEVNQLLTVDTHHERRHIDQLLAHTDVTLLDEAACMMDRLGKA